MLKKKVGQFVLACFALIMFASTLASEPGEWDKLTQQARGQTIYFNGWGGSEQINDYLVWAAREANKRFGISVRHIKVNDASTIVSRVLAEKNAGRNNRGSVDLVWINGQNFRTMKQHGLLYGPFTEKLPNFRLIDPKEKPSTVSDFGEPVEGLQAPWGMAQLVFIYDSDFVKKTPGNAQEFLAFAGENKGRVTYPMPPDFVGTSFLKQLLLELSENPGDLLKPVSETGYEKVTAPLWRYLDKLHPLLWRQGRTFPVNHLALTPLLDDGEILLSMTFNPGYASSAIASGELAESIRTYIHEGGTLSNSHFLAIPYNSDAKEAAQVFANFLMSPEAQARKANSDIWGDPTVLSMSRLNQDDRKKFEYLPLGKATLSGGDLDKTLPEPHNSWVDALETDWQRRYR